MHAELTHHLDYEKHDPSDGNSRNLRGQSDGSVPSSRPELHFRQDVMSLRASKYFTYTRVWFCCGTETISCQRCR